MLEQTLRNTKQKMETVLLALGEQLKGLHVGRASVALVEQIEVDYYGAKQPLKQVGSITIPEANQIVITPWDKGALAPIEAAIRASDLGVNPINDGKGVRIVLPPLTEERRRELAKIVSQMAEEARIALRNERRTAWESIQEAPKAGTLTEDDRDRGRAELDTLIGGLNKRVEEIVKEKEHEMMSF